jgi:hypothetical protein
MTISLDDIILKNPQIAQRIFDDRMLVITAKDSMLHRFDEVGTFIWKMLDNKLSVKDICDSIEESFEGFDRKKNTSEILSFLETLEKKNLVLISKTD